jgi:hypothetical protein
MRTTQVYDMIWLHGKQDCAASSDAGKYHSFDEGAMAPIEVLKVKNVLCKLHTPTQHKYRNGKRAGGASEKRFVVEVYRSENMMCRGCP